MRRTKEDTEKTRLAILAAAEKLFVNDGFSQTSLEKIAAEVGCTRGAIYWHFVNKNGLLYALKEKQQSPMQELVEYLKDNSNADPLENLQDMTLKIFRRMESEPGRRELLSLMMDLEMSNLMGSNTYPENQFYNAVFSSIKDIFSLAEKHGILNPCWKVERITVAFMSMVGGLVRDWVKRDVDYNMKNDAAEIVTTFLKMIRV